MNELLGQLLGVMLATNQVLAASNLVARTTGFAVPVVNPDDPVEQEFQKLLAEDDAAQNEVDAWIKEDTAFRAHGAGAPGATLNVRIDQRFEGVVKRYEDFVFRHPEHARARLAYGSFLNDTGREEEALVQWDRACELDPKNPAAWNNLAHHYSHRGPIKKAFDYYAKAIELNPKESVYYQNLATAVFLFRKDAKEHYQLDDDQKVFRRALELYRKARERDPGNFALATDLAQTYYYLKPLPGNDGQVTEEAKARLVDEAVTAWRVAQKVARDDLERDGVSIHLARVCLQNGRYPEAREYLETVRHPDLRDLRRRLERNLAEKAGTPEAKPASGPSPERK